MPCRFPKTFVVRLKWDVMRVKGLSCDDSDDDEGFLSLSNYLGTVCT